jgi:predicted PurR-regulated permease PerM
MVRPAVLNKKTVWALGVGGFLILVAAASYALYDSLLPLFLAFGLAYALSPVVDFLEKRGVPRAWGAALLLLGLALTAALLAASFIPAVLRDGREFIQNLPDYFSAAVQKIAEIGERYGFEVPVRQELVEKVRAHLREASLAALSPAVGLARSVFSGVGNAAVFVLNFLIVPVFFFYFLRDLPGTKRYAFELIPPRHRALARAKWEELDRVFSGYIRGQMTVALILAGVFAVGLSIMGVKFGLFIGLVAGLLNIVPYLGQITGLALSLTMALVDFTGWGRLAAIPLLFGGANFVEGTFITPKIVGDKVGLSPVQTILALIVGGQVAGIAGLLVAIPVAGSVKVLLSDAVEAYRKSDLYRGHPAP